MEEHNHEHNHGPYWHSHPHSHMAESVVGIPTHDHHYHTRFHHPAWKDNKPNEIKRDAARKMGFETR